MSSLICWKRGARSGASACLILGDEEAQNQTVQIKWLATGEQTAITQADLLANPDQLRQQLQTTNPH
ncbi:His/Gly/Thr/Pro-type tRNA ligase C-terminal domain-containing protein [Laspinema olomoucense]|uniref:His/Gly/Thr/Pro-type tRNA ligase C-terminal domain-containing protein n=1 Tax=Laspinema olomoucense TaxID=3231600 RepID=UPI00294FFD74|nr:His/Gly/Thr/Pro-type tRNA ligase C-terminal domain-containing protein [Laspinema sp. D3d]